MSAWVETICGYVLLVSVVMQMMINPKYEPYVKLVTGALLILLVLQPVLKIGSVNLQVEEQITAFLEQEEQLEEELWFQKEAFIQKSQSLEEPREIKISEIESVEVKLGD